MCSLVIDLCLCDLLINTNKLINIKCGLIYTAPTVVKRELVSSDYMCIQNTNVRTYNRA